MAGQKIKIEHWGVYLGILGQRAHAAAERGILAGAQRCVQVMQRRTETAVPASANGSEGAINTGGYRRQWRVAKIARGARLYNENPAASTIEGGRRAGGRMPPLREVERWARRRMGLSADEARRAAYPIARAIARRGLRPRRVMTGALREMAGIVTAEAQHELQRALGMH